MDFIVIILSRFLSSALVTFYRKKSRLRLVNRKQSVFNKSSKVSEVCISACQLWRVQPLEDLCSGAGAKGRVTGLVKVMSQGDAGSGDQKIRITLMTTMRIRLAGEYT